ncbi:MAG: DUF2085 domain-containing protein [Bryobacterales bacterium]|nr:DUF2085 domain-containing protein [Bryobacterales bacterium]
MIPPLRLGLAALALSALSIATLAPVAASSGHSTESAALYLALGPLCHQRSERSWSYQGQPAGLCIRCYGLHAGILAAAVLGLRFRPRLAAAGALTLGGVWAFEHLGGAAVSPLLRFSSGGVFGLALVCLAPESLFNRPKPLPAKPRRIQ